MQTVAQIKEKPYSWGAMSFPFDLCLTVLDLARK